MAEFSPNCLCMQWAAFIARFEVEDIAVAFWLDFAKMVGVKCPPCRWELEREALREWSVVVVAFAVPPFPHHLLFLRIILFGFMRHLTNVHRKRCPIHFSTVPEFVPWFSIDMLLGGLPVLLVEGLQELLVVSCKLRHREHK